MQLATVAQVKGWPWNSSFCVEQSCQIRLFKLIKPHTILGSPMLPTSLYEIVLGKGFLLILLLVTSCPVMISAASCHHSAVIRNGHLVTGLKQRDGQSLCLEQTWAGFSGAIPWVISCDIHFCAASSDTSLVPQELYHCPHASVPPCITFTSLLTTSCCWYKSKKVTARETAVSFGDVLPMEEFCFNLKGFLHWKSFKLKQKATMGMFAPWNVHPFRQQQSRAGANCIFSIVTMAAASQSFWMAAVPKNHLLQHSPGLGSWHICQPRTQQFPVRFPLPWEKVRNAAPLH